jgi:hypothetical protein
MQIWNYFNIASPEYQKACTGFSDMSVPKKVTIIVLTALAGIFGVGVGAIPVFRLLTENWKPKSTDITSLVFQKFFQGTKQTVKSGSISTNPAAPIPPLAASINGKDYPLDEAGNLTPEPDYTQISDIGITVKERQKKLNHIPEWVLKCSCLQSLVLQDCDFTEPLDLTMLKNLKSLRLIADNLQTSPNLTGLSKLEVISLDHNKNLKKSPNLSSCHENLHILDIDQQLVKEAKKLPGPAEGKLYVRAYRPDGAVEAFSVPES